MLRALVTFVPIAALLTLTPGVATALVVRNASRGGRRAAFFTTAGNSIGVLMWGALAAAGLAAAVATSARVFTVVKVVGAAVLFVMGARSLLGRDAGSTGVEGEAPVPARAPSTDLSSARDGLITSVANPKLAVFFVALFPQFIPRHAPVLAAALAMAGLIVAFDLVWYTALAYLVTRAKRAFVAGPWARRVERMTGAVLIGLGIRLAIERR